MVIGVDFDNTLICYDQIFHRLAVEEGLISRNVPAQKKAIRDADLAVIVEGYMDVLMSHQVGVANVVAGMGTALTEGQMRQLKRYSSNLTLALDPDAAGDHATLRGLEAARQALEREWQPTFSPTGARI